MNSGTLTQAAMRFLARSPAPSTSSLLIETLTRAIGCDGGEAWLMDDDRVLRLAGAWYTNDIDGAALREAAGILEWDAAEPWIKIIDPATTPRATDFAKAGITSAVAVPMLARGTMWGVLVFLSRGKDRPAQSVLE